MNTFDKINMQLSSMQGVLWLLIANSCNKSCFTDSLGREIYNFSRQQFKQMVLEFFWSHPRVYSFYTNNAAFHYLKLLQDEIIGVHDVIILSTTTFHL